jgi:hypothetical protein
VWAGGASFDDLVAHGIGQRFGRVGSVYLVAVDMQQRVEFRQGEFSVAMQHGQADGTQRTSEEPVGLVAGGWQRGVLGSGRPTSVGVVLAAPQPVMDVTESFDERAALGGEHHRGSIKFGQFAS